MPLTIDPPLKRTIYTAKKLHYPVNQQALKTFKMVMVSAEATNILAEAPVADKVYTYNGKNYGQPKFQLLPEQTDHELPGEQGFIFTKDKEGKIFLNVILECYHPDENVQPLDFRNLNISFQYAGTAGMAGLPLSIKQILPDSKKTNILKHIYAQAEISAGDKEQIYESLVTTEKSAKLLVNAEVWWQKATNPTPHPSPTHQPASVTDSCSTFNPAALQVRGNDIFSGNTRLMAFRNPKDALRALQAIRFYKMDRKCLVGGDQFSYFLSGGNAPSGQINGEDCLPFDPAKLQVINASNRWKISDGRSWMFDFGSNEANARQALAVIKKHGFDATCYVGRPNPGMIYLKRNRMAILRTAILMKPTLMHTMGTMARPVRGRASLPVQPETVGQPETVAPQKVDIHSEINLLFERKDPGVFQGFFDDLESKEYKWHKEEKIDFQDPDKTYGYYYRLTNDPNTVCFLPQVYRIGVNHDTGEPNVDINMYANMLDNGEREYRINMSFQVVPYFHPRAKKDLMNHLFRLSEKKIKYVDNLVLGGYQKVSFELESRFLSDNALFSQKITEKLEEIDPSAGFTITADHSLESFEAFKDDLMKDGIDIGKIYFELEEETREGSTITKSKPITVELNFKKMENIPLTIENLDPGNGEVASAPAGFFLKNPTSVPLNIGGVELTLLSVNDNFIYDVDYDLSTQGIEWPAKIQASKKEGIFLNQSDISSLTDDNMIWNSLVCEPFDTRSDIDTEKILASVIDHATGDPEMWKLHISSPLYENWEAWTDEQKAPYSGILGVIVEIKTDDSEISSVRIDQSNPKQTVEMARTVQQLLARTKQENKHYEYRQTNITLTPSQPGNWKSSESTGVEHLLIYPEIQQ